VTRGRAIVRAFLVAWAVSGCAALEPGPTPAPTARLADRLIGQWVAVSDESEVAEVVLQIEPVLVEQWDLEDGLYLYVTMKPAEGPWRHALYRLVPDRRGRVVVESFAYGDETLRRTDSPVPAERAEMGGLDVFVHRNGCDMTFEYRANGGFYGRQAERRACRPGDDGADWVYAEKIVSPQQLIWWERGYAADGEPLWGPERPGYVFRRVGPQGR
jgi:hypothetical protein